MKLLSINCHAYQEENQQNKIKILAQTIVAQDYDVVCLQEVSQSINSKIVDGIMREDLYLLVLLNEIKELSTHDYYFIWDYSHIGFDVFEEGVGILSKHPIIESKSFYVSENKSKEYWKSRNIVKASISIHSEVIDFYSCHLGWWHDEEEDYKKQVDHLLKEMNPDRLSFFMGDFNNCGNLRNQGYDYILSCGLFDTYNLAKDKDEGNTILGEIHGWEGQLVPMRIDYCFSNQLINVLKSHTLFNGVNKPKISDHFGLEVIIKR